MRRRSMPAVRFFTTFVRTSLIRTLPPLGPYCRPMLRVLGWPAFSYERGTPVLCGQGMVQGYLAPTLWSGRGFAPDAEDEEAFDASRPLLHHLCPEPLLPHPEEREYLIRDHRLRALIPSNNR